MSAAIAAPMGSGMLIKFMADITNPLAKSVEGMPKTVVISVKTRTSLSAVEMSIFCMLFTILLIWQNKRGGRYYCSVRIFILTERLNLFISSFNDDIRGFVTTSQDKLSTINNLNNYMLARC